jgi:DNA-binding XRE family transcriptional regulator
MDVLAKLVTMTPAEWHAWQAKALAADAERTRSLTEARARRPAHPPCEDPFCPRCVPFGRHLDPDVQQRRREAWAQQDVRRARELAGQRQADEAEGLVWLQDLARLREAAGLTQAALATKVGISRQSVNAIEAGRKRPRPRVARRLREILGPLRPSGTTPGSLLQAAQGAAGGGGS